MPQTNPQLRAHIDIGEELGRELSARLIMFHRAVAERLGLNLTDHKCAELLLRLGPLTAGELARETGLTTGAITGVIDRLEQAGYARRQRDVHDRRRVIVHAVMDPARGQEVQRLLSSYGRAAGEVLASYDPAARAAIKDYLIRCNALLRDETMRLQQETARYRPTD